MFLDSFIIQVCISRLWFSLAPLKNQYFTSYNAQVLPSLLSFPFILLLEETQPSDCSVSHSLDFAGCPLLGQLLPTLGTVQCIPLPSVFSAHGQLDLEAPSDPASVLLTRLYGFLHQLPLCWMYLAGRLRPWIHYFTGGANMVTYTLFTVLWFTFYCLLIFSFYTSCK